MSLGGTKTHKFAVDKNILKYDEAQIYFSLT